ncbi:MAG TPA: RNA-binding cell elongation regulator Jag/EloR [Syntrophales bacterium]|nr:RNA-binding cell elongation regulator Jag/EloR [Syntrophales bacterium]HPQ44647.1 RNA-binding cell elongation regulator Jag/EloR [Syntrophales bacterium]
MKDVLEIEEKTIDQAIQKACDTFNLPREKLNIEILSEGSSGLLGLLGARKARIRARIMSFDIGGGKDTTTHRNEPTEDVEAETDGDISLRAQAFIEGLLSHVGVDFSVKAEENEEYIVLTIEGDGGGLLIGRGGQTLDAIQYLTNKVLNKNGNGRKRIILDTENYRKKREQNLSALAEKLGEKAKKTRRPVTVNPMNAHDRRIIHMALQNDSDLTTRSRGEGAFRKIVIVPNKNGKPKP